VIRILVPDNVRVLPSVWRRDNQKAIVSQNTPDLANSVVLLLDVLNRLETHDRVNGAAPEGNLVEIPDTKLQVWPGTVSMLCMHDGVGRIVDSYDRRRDAGQYVRSVALAGCDIEHSLAAAQLACDEISMDVLQANFTLDSRHIPFSRPFQL
jgi:hypothetical protein